MPYSKAILSFLPARVALIGLILLASLFLIAHPSSAHAASQTRPLSTVSCYGDGLPNWNPPYAACDSVVAPPANSAVNCNNNWTVENSKPIGSSNDGVIGTLYVYFSTSTIQNGQPIGCNSWWGQVQITAPGVYRVHGVSINETGSDSSFNVNGPLSLSQGESLYSPMDGDFQPGGCYYAHSVVADGVGVDQYTSTNTFCF